MDGSVGQTTSPVISDGPFLRSGTSGQVWNVVGKLKKDHYYLLVDAGAVSENLGLAEREAQMWRENMAGEQ